MKTVWAVVEIYFNSMGISPTVSATAWVCPAKGSGEYDNRLISRAHRENNTCIFPNLAEFFSARNISFLPGKKKKTHDIAYLNCIRPASDLAQESALKQLLCLRRQQGKATKQTASQTWSQAHFTHSLTETPVFKVIALIKLYYKGRRDRNWKTLFQSQEKCS